MPLGTLRRQLTFGGAGKTWVIAVDGSTLSLRALKLAVSLCKLGVDELILVSVETEKNSSAQIETMFHDYEAALQNSGVQVANLGMAGSTGRAKTRFEKLPLDGDIGPTEDAIATTIRRFAERLLEKKETILVIGRAGRGAEDASASRATRPKGAAPMSKLGRSA